MHYESGFTLLYLSGLWLRTQHQFSGNCASLPKCDQVRGKGGDRNVGISDTPIANFGNHY